VKKHLPGGRWKKDESNLACGWPGQFGGAPKGGPIHTKGERGTNNEGGNTGNLCAWKGREKTCGPSKGVGKKQWPSGGKKNPQTYTGSQPKAKAKNRSPKVTRRRKESKGRGSSTCIARKFRGKGRNVKKTAKP